METATNPQTGETIAYVNGQWVPLPTGGLSFDRLRNTPRPVTPLDGAAYAAPAEDVGLGGQFMRSAVNAAGADTVAGIGGALQSLGFEETGQGLRDWGERNALPPAGVRSIGEIDSWGDIPSYVANMGGMAVGSTLPVVGTAAVGALAGSAVPVVGTVAGGLTGAALGSYGINEGQTYIQIRQALEDAGASKEDAHTTAAEIAIPLGIPIAALDVFSLSRALPFLKGSVRDAAQSVVEEAAKRGLLGTAARESGRVALTEGGTETGQTVLQELGQASVDPNYDWSQLGTKMVDSAVAGALGGGMFGAFDAPSARANARAEVARRADVAEQDAARAAAIETRDQQNRVIDQIAGQQLLLPPPSAETRRTPYRAAAMADLTAAQDAVTRVEGTLAAYPTPANQKRLEIVTRARDSALARLESIDQTDVFASQQEAPQVSATTRSAIEDQETERRRKAAVDAEAAARGVAPAAVTREQTAGEALRLRLESIDRAIRSVKADLKQRPGFAPSVAKLNFYDQQRAAAVAALGPKPADQLSGATRTIRAPSPDTDIQAFARETARKIVGDPNFWVPIKESDKAPVTGYVNYQTGEIRTPEQHAAPIETPLSGRDPTIPSPEEMAKRAQVERDVAQGATAAQDAAAADQAVVERQRQDAVTAAQNAQREAIAEQEKADAATATAAPEPVGETPNSEQVGDAPQGLPSARPVAPGTTILPGQKDVPVDYAVVEADEVIASQDEDGRPNQFYPPALQPRDRTRASSEQQITELANRLDPRLLDQSPRWNDGAPIVGADGFVDSGNGRTLAIKRAYERGLPTAENYKRHLAEQGYPVEGMQKPMLVRIDRSGADLQTRATRNDVGNKPAGLGLSPTEQAASDARLMGDAILDSYRGGALTDAANRPLIRQFMERAMTTEERGRALTSDGEINQDAVRRVQNALLARAYGDPSLIEKLVEDQDNNVRSIGGAMLDASPTWGKMRAAVAEGRLDPQMDPTGPLIEAMRLVSRARSDGILLGDLVAQQDAFSGRTISPNAEFLLRMMFRDAGLRLPVGREKLADRLRQIANKVSRTAESDDIFGGAPDLGGILQEATEGANREDAADSTQGDLLARKPGPVGAPGGVRGGASAGGADSGKAIPKGTRAKNAGSGSKVGTTESVVSAKGPKAAAEARAAAKAAATDTPSKPKKGDLVAIEETSTANYQGGRAPTTSSRWRFARITKMKADGTVESVTPSTASNVGSIFAPGTRGRQTWSRIATINRDKMPDGMTAVDVMTATEAENFRTPEELRDAFIAMGAKTTKAPGGPAIASESEAPAKKPAAKLKPDKAMRPDEPGAEPTPQSHEARIAKAETDIRAMLKRMTGKDIDFSLIGEPLMIDGQAAAGGYNTQTGALVVSAFDDSGHAYSPDQLLGIARHEAIHWMKDNGLFPEGSWSALEKATPAWMTRFKIKERYGNLTAEQQREEAIAEAYRAWGAGRLKLRGGPIQTAFEFIKRMLASIRGLFQQNGFQSVEDIFRGIDTGAFAKADAETGPSGSPGMRAAQAASTRSPQFKRWFGRSKVVGSDGEPLVVYHGTRAGGFNIFAPKIRANQQLGFGIHFAEDRSLAAKYADDDAVARRGKTPQTYAAYVSIKNPLLADEIVYEGSPEFDLAYKLAGKNFFYAKDEGGRRGVYIQNAIDATSPARAQALIRAAGYDGVRYNAKLRIMGVGSSQTMAEGRSWVALDPTQVKSADSNIGSFDPNDPDIRMMRPSIGRTSEWTMLAIGGAPGAPATMSIEDQMRASTARVWGVDRLFGDTKTARSVGSFIDRTRGSLQYYMLPWQRAEEAVERITGQPLPEGVRATTAELYVTGKLGHARLEKDRLYYQPVMDLIKKHNIPLADVGNYLLAMHAPERNAQIAKINPKKSGNPLPDGTPTTRDGSGITDAEAAKRLKELNAKPYAPQLAEIQKLIVEMNNAGLDILVQGGRMSTAQAERLKTMYQNYVNLSGIEDPDAEFDEAGSGTGRGFMGTRGPAVKRATGRFSEPTEILANSLAEFDARVARAEKNLVAQAAFNLAAAHPDPNVWTVDPVERKARINPKTGNVSYTIQQDRGADVMLAYVDGDPFAVRFNTQRQQGRDLYESLAKLNGVEVNRVFALMMRANQLLSRLNTTLNPEFMLSAPIKDWQEAGINLQQYGVKRVAQKTAGHLPGAMKAAYRYMGGKEPGGEWDKWAHDFAAGGGITYFADQTSSESYVKQINRDIKKRSGPVGLTMGGVRALWHAIERTNNAADMGTRLAAYRTLVEAGMSKPKAVAAAKNLTVNFNRKGSQGPAMNALFMFFNASVQGTATMATAIKNSNVVKGLVLGVVATGIAQELALSLLSPPDPDDPTRTVYDAIPEYVKQRNLILWVDDDGSYGMFPKPWGYGFFHDVGRVMTRYLRGAPMGVGRSASVLDTIRDTATSFANAFVPPGFDSALPVPTIFNPLVEVATNKDYTGKPIMPARMPGDRRPNSQMFYPGESPITVGVADALNSLTGGDQFRPGLVDISPEALSHVFSSYAGAAGSFYTRAANTIWGAGAETLGFNREDPDLDWNDVPFGRKIMGQTGSWQVQDLTYQRIADVELLEDEIAGYQEQGDRERARELRAQNGPLVALAKEGRRVRRELSEMRRDRQALLDGPLPTDQARARIDALEARQDRVMAAWNARYVRALARVQARTP